MSSSDVMMISANELAQTEVPAEIWTADPADQQRLVGSSALLAAIITCLQLYNIQKAEAEELRMKTVASTPEHKNAKLIGNLVKVSDQLSARFAQLGECHFLAFCFVFVLFCIFYSMLRFCFVSLS
jgi:hypothetical protein